MCPFVQCTASDSPGIEQIAPGSRLASPTGVVGHQPGKREGAGGKVSAVMRCRGSCMSGWSWPASEDPVSPLLCSINITAV